MLVWKILMCLAFCLWILLMWRRRKFYMLFFKTQGPLGLPIIGSLHKVKSLEDVLLYAEIIIKNYESPFLCWAGPIPVLGVFDPQTAQDILISPHCVNRSILYKSVTEVLGSGLFSANNPEWSAHRKLLNPAFSSENLRSFTPIFNETTKAFVRDFAISYEGEPINILPIMQKLTMNMALQTTMGIVNRNTKGDGDWTKYDKLFEYYHYLLEKTMSLIVYPWLRFEFIQNFLPSFKAYKTIKSELMIFFTNLIHDKLEILSSTNITANKLTTSLDVDDNVQKENKHIFIDIGIELLRNAKFTIENLEGHANHIIIGAFETTATTITHALTLLAMNPRCQEIAFKELSSIYTDRDNISVSNEDLHHLGYLERVINETMRLISTVPIIGRTTTDDVRLSNGIIIPAGTQLAVDLFHLHRNVNVWGPQALIYNPDNFLPENLRDKHPYAFIPFTKGTRNCIGWRYGVNVIKIVLAIVLRKYVITTTSKFEDFRYEPSVTTRLINTPLLKLHLREN